MVLVSWYYIYYSLLSFLLSFRAAVAVVCTDDGLLDQVWTDDGLLDQVWTGITVPVNREISPGPATNQVSDLTSCQHEVCKHVYFIYM